MTWKIVCDSSCDLKTGELDTGNIRFETVPLRLLVGETTYVDDASLNVSEMLAAMKENDGPTSSACPSPAAFADAFMTCDNTICFCMTSGLSGTYNAALVARDMVLEEHPEKCICVIDSRSTAGALVLLAKRAIALISENEDKNFEDLCNELRVYQASLRVTFTLENYDNLIKNGRMRPLVGTLLHSLHIHVVAEGTVQGVISVTKKCRGQKKTYQAIVEQMRQSKDCTAAQVVISHCENLAGAIKLKEMILEALPVKSVSIMACRGLTSFYAMEKGLIVVS